MTQHSPNAEIIDVTRERQSLFVSPMCPELDRLRTCRVEAVNDADLGFQLRRVPFPLYHESSFAGATEIEFDRGLRPAIDAILRERGREVRHYSIGPQIAELPAPEPAPWLPQRYPYQQVVDWMFETTCGLIVSDPSRVCLPALIESMHRAYPRAQIGVASESVARLQSLALQLRQRGTTVRVMTARRDIEEPAPLSLATYYGLGWRHTSQYDVILALDAVEALSERAKLVLPDASRARLYGIVPETRNLTRGEQDHLTARFGFERCHVAGPFEIVRPVSHRFIGLPVARPIAGQTPMDVRLGLVRDPVRNDHIGRTARHLVASSNDPSQCHEAGQPFPRGILIVVESPEHAVRIARQLPNWRIVAANVIATSLREHDRELLVARMNLNSPNIIVTLSSLARLKLDAIDVVVRATSGPGLVPLNRITTHWTEGPLLLFDIEDRHHPQLRRWVRQRRAAYQAAEWTPVGIDPAQARIDRFLDQLRSS